MEPVSKEETLEVNVRQKEFYNNTSGKKNVITSAWSYIRNRMISDFRTEYGIKDRVYNKHKEWLGDLSGKKVLDLGCLRGNALSIYMAGKAGSYMGIDLSDVAIEKLKKKLEKNNCINAKALAVDFYSDEFTERDFDIIYAYGVMHHFPDLDQLFKRISEVSKPGAKLIIYDPMQTSFPVRLIRNLYRPFQSDKEWEWPFDKSAIRKISSSFKVEEMHGVLGKSKYAMLFNFLPLPGKKKLFEKWIEKDWNCKIDQSSLYSCMQVTMLLRINETTG